MGAPGAGRRPRRPDGRAATAQGLRAASMDEPHRRAGAPTDPSPAMSADDARRPGCPTLCRPQPVCRRQRKPSSGSCETPLPASKSPALADTGEPARRPGLPRRPGRGRAGRDCARTSGKRCRLPTRRWPWYRTPSQPQGHAARARPRGVHAGPHVPRRVRLPRADADLGRAAVDDDRGRQRPVHLSPTCSSGR